MQLLLNVLWATLGGGFVIALQYVIGGAILCVTLVGIPFGLQCFKLAGLALFPFGKDIVEDESAERGTLWAFISIVWLIFGGATTFVSHLALGLSLAVSIIGIPFAYQHLKLAALSLFPFGQRVVTP